MKHGFFVHWPVALLLTSVGLDLWAMWKAKAEPRKAAYYTLLIGVGGGILAFISGVFLEERMEERFERFAEAAGGMGGPMGGAMANLEIHRALALVAMLVFIGLAVWRYKTSDFEDKEMPNLYLGAAILGAVLILATGFFGGSIRGAEERERREGGGGYYQRYDEPAFERGRFERGENGMRPEQFERGRGEGFYR